MAEGVFRHLVEEADLADRFEITSAGTGSWHVGERAHPGTRGVLQRHGIGYAGRAQQLAYRDVADEKAWIIAMDSSNYGEIQRKFGDRPRLHRLLEFAEDHPEVRDVPDPYYTGGFDYVYQLVADGCRGLLAEIREVEEI